VAMTNLTDKLIALGEAVVVGAIATWFTSIIKAGLKNALESVTEKLASALLSSGIIKAETRLWLVEGAAPVIGKWGSLLIGGALGTLIGGVVVYGVVELFKYLALADYTLSGQVYNFDAEHEWQIESFYGRNEKVVEGPSKGAIPKCKPAGKVVIPGMTVASDAGSAAVYFKTFSFVNEHSTAGGFTVAGYVRRIPKAGESDLGVNFAYRVEKAADNSLAVEVNSGRKAESYFKEVLGGSSVSGGNENLKKQKELKHESSGVKSAITSPELYNADKDVYSCRLEIGTPPDKDKWHAIGA